MFDGKVVDYNRPQKNENFKQHFLNVVMPTLNKNNIVLETFDDGGIYQLDKTKIGIKII
jgi:hypothetical protein